MTETVPAIPGVNITLGGLTFTAAPLNFKALREFGPVIDAFGAGKKTAISDLPLLQNVIAASIRRNHPDVTDEFLENWLDTVNIRTILADVLRASGVQELPKDDASGEARPVAANGQAATGIAPTSI